VVTPSLGENAVGLLRAEAVVCVLRQRLRTCHGRVMGRRQSAVISGNFGLRCSANSISFPTLRRVSVSISVSTTKTYGSRTGSEKSYIQDSHYIFPPFWSPALQIKQKMADMFSSHRVFPNFSVECLNSVTSRGSRLTVTSLSTLSIVPRVIGTSSSPVFSAR